MIKQCMICGKKFKMIQYASKQKCCSQECSKSNYIKNKKRYNELDINRIHFKEYRKAYRQTKAYNDSAKIQRQRKKYKEDQRKYDHSPKGKQTKKDHLKRYMHTNEFKITQKKYRLSDLGKACSRRSRVNRRARINNIIELFTLEKWKDKLERTNGICLGINGRCLSVDSNVGISQLCTDHIYPVKKANEDYKTTGIKRVYTINDIQFLCRRCNASKCDKIIEPIFVPIISPEPRALEPRTCGSSVSPNRLTSASQEESKPKSL